MKVLLVNTTETRGGAAIATQRLRDALLANGVKARMLVTRKTTDSLTVTGLPGSLLCRWRFAWERLRILLANRLSRRNLFQIDTATSGADVTRLKAFREADIIHLNWVNQGMLSLDSLKRILRSGKPVVWTMHDMWNFTGVCHYVGDCDRYRTHCADCPLLAHPGGRDLAARTFDRKRRAYTCGQIHFVAVSSWLADTARQSALLRGQTVKVIPNVLPLKQFVLQDKRQSRTALQLPDKHILVFGAIRIDEERKGLRLLNEALRRLLADGRRKADDLHLALFGGIKDGSVLRDIPVPYTYLGFLPDNEALARLYAAADAAVVPSLYETFGQTIIEAQACGCLPVTFGGSGQDDIINHRANGFLATPHDTASLADGIEWALQTDIAPQELRDSVLSRYSSTIVAQQYARLYESITGE